MNPADLWSQLPLAFLFTVAVETPILFVLLSPRHGWRVRLFSGVWLTACTYPVVFLVLPLLCDYQNNRAGYLLIAETFAPLAECALFWAAFGRKDLLGTRSMWRDGGAIVVANLASFGLGELVYHLQEVHDRVNALPQ